MHGTHLLHPCSSISVTPGLPVAWLEQSRSTPLRPTVVVEPRTQSAYSTGGGESWREVVGDLPEGVVVEIDELIRSHVKSLLPSTKQWTSEHPSGRIDPLSSMAGSFAPRSNRQTTGWGSDRPLARDRR